MGPAALRENRGRMCVPLLVAKSSARPGSLRLWFRTILGAPITNRAFRENGDALRFLLLPVKSFARPGLLEALKSDVPWRPCELEACFGKTGCS